MQPGNPREFLCAPKHIQKRGETWWLFGLQRRTQQKLAASGSMASSGPTLEAARSASVDSVAAACSSMPGEAPGAAGVGSAAKASTVHVSAPISVDRQSEPGHSTLPFRKGSRMQPHLPYPARVIPLARRPAHHHGLPAPLPTAAPSPWPAPGTHLPAAAGHPVAGRRAAAPAQRLQRRPRRRAAQRRRPLAASGRPPRRRRLSPGPPCRGTAPPQLQQCHDKIRAWQYCGVWLHTAACSTPNPNTDLNKGIPEGDDRCMPNPRRQLQAGGCSTRLTCGDGVLACARARLLVQRRDVPASDVTTCQQSGV